MTSYATRDAPTHAVVLGAGVLGLTSAWELRKKGLRVTILARDLPQDTFSQSFASPWAGANWCSFAVGDEAMRRREAYTYRVYQQLAKQLPEDVLAFMPFICLHDKKYDYQYYWFREVVGGIDEEPAQLAGATLGPPYAYKFRSLCLNVPKYTEWLVAQLERDMPSPVGPPVEFVRIAAASSLRAAAQLFKDATLLVNATGLGSQDLADVRDEKLYPIRGQTVLVNAPRFREESVARCINSLSGSGPSYVIPRARSGQVILGGSFDVRQTRPLSPNNQLTERIIKDAIRQVPELLPEGVDPQDPEAWKKVDVLRVNVGVRPAREGGARIELDTKPISLEGRQVGVIHAYGIGPAGYQASYGIAAEVAQLADQWQTLQRTQAKL